MQQLFSFLKDEESIIDVDNAMFVNDKTPCMRENISQHLLQSRYIKFWVNDTWSGDLTNLNVVECIQKIIKSEVDKKLLLKRDRSMIFKKH